MERIFSAIHLRGEELTVKSVNCGYQTASKHSQIVKAVQSLLCTGSTVLCLVDLQLVNYTLMIHTLYSL